MDKIKEIFLISFLLVINLSFIIFSLFKESYLYTALFFFTLIPVLLNVKYYFVSQKNKLSNTPIPYVDSENLQLPTHALKDSIKDIVKSSSINPSTLADSPLLSFIEKKELNSSESELQQLEDLINDNLHSNNNLLVLSNFSGEYKSDSSLAHYFRGSIDFNDIICKNIIDNVSLIPHTGYDSIIDSHQFVNFLNDEGKNFDKVIFYFNKSTLEKITADFTNLQLHNSDNTEKMLINDELQTKTSLNIEEQPHASEQTVSSEV